VFNIGTLEYIFIQQNHIKPNNLNSSNFLNIYSHIDNNYYYTDVNILGYSVTIFDQHIKIKDLRVVYLTQNDGVKYVFVKSTAYFIISTTIKR